MGLDKASLRLVIDFITAVGKKSRVFFGDLNSILRADIKAPHEMIEKPL